MKGLSKLLNLAVGMGLGGLFLWYIFHDLDYGRLLKALEHANYGYLPLYASTVLGYHLIRIFRWHLMLQPLHPYKFRRTFQIGSVGFLSIFLLPFRLGELVRPYLAAQEPKVKFSSVLATIMVERTIDGIVLTLLFFVLAMLAPNIDDPNIPLDLAMFGKGALLVFAVSLAGIVTLMVLGERGMRLAELIGGLFSRRFGTRLARLVGNFLEGIRVVHGYKKAGAFLLLTLAYWTTNGLGGWILFHALHETSHLPLVAGYGLMAVLGVAVMVPNLPGFVGAFQVAVYLALLMYDGSIDKESAIALSFIMQGTVLAVQAGCGLPFVLTGRVSLLKTVKSSEDAQAMLDADVT
ncbi:MAG: flippase-like domain-containing protein [Deltaproteobacteria bacterium]|nr:flippase-like domain-containing protein [Deltaproteobacteria bacterium]